MGKMEGYRPCVVRNRIVINFDKMVRTANVGVRRSSTTSDSSKLVEPFKASTMIIVSVLVC